MIYNNFDNPSENEISTYCRDTSTSGRYSIRMGKGREFSPGMKMKYAEISDRDYIWLRVCCNVWFSCRPEEAKGALVISCNKDGKPFKYRMLPIETANLEPLTWNQVCLPYRTPYLENRSETVDSYFWVYGDKEILLDDFRVEVFTPE